MKNGKLKSASAAGKALVAMRRTADITCAICSAVFHARLGASYCSNRCRQAAKYQRAKAGAAG